MELSRGKKILVFSTFIIVGLYFLFLALVEASSFLAPLFTAIILALVVLPLSRKMERKGMKRSVSSLLNVLLLFLISLGLLALLSFQVQSFMQKWPQIKETMKPKIEQLQSFVLQHTQMSKSDLQNPGSLGFSSGSQGSSGKSGSSGAPGSGGDFQQQGNSGDSSAGSSISQKAQQAMSFFMKTIGFIGTALLTFIYIFFLLNYRRRFRLFVLRLFPEREKKEANDVIYRSAKVSQQYLVGRLLLMAALAVLYAIGFGISGVSNFILISLIAALFSLIPYIGNIIGLVLAMGFGYLTSGATGVLVGILVTFAVAQFVESYLLEPYVVGDKVDVHPFFVILAVVAGGALWGIIGMILAIPLLAIITVIFLHVSPLHPFGFLFSKKKPEE